MISQEFNNIMPVFCQISFPPSLINHEQKLVLPKRNKIFKYQMSPAQWESKGGSRLRLIISTVYYNLHVHSIFKSSFP